MPAEDPVAHAGSQDDSPVATKGFGAREDADATRQAQHVEANDTPIDVNPNAALARIQTQAYAMLGQNAVDNADLRQKMADANSDWREITKGKLFGTKPQP